MRVAYQIPAGGLSLLRTCFHGNIIYKFRVNCWNYFEDLPESSADSFFFTVGIMARSNLSLRIR